MVRLPLIVTVEWDLLVAIASHLGLCSAGVGPYKAPDEQSWRSADFTQYLQNKDDEFCSSWELELSVSLVPGFSTACAAAAVCIVTPRPLRGPPGDGAAALEEPQQALGCDTKQPRVARDAVRNPFSSRSRLRAQGGLHRFCSSHHCTRG